ncbi:MAG: hypothetical protein U0R69_03990 [Gaiellales bacterium]
MPDLWVPGAAGPSVEDLVARLHRAIEAFAVRRDFDQVAVEIQLHDGTRLNVHQIRAEPGYGFVTLCPIPEDETRPWPKAGEDGGCTPEELIVPVGSIVRITLGKPEAQARFGFSVPQDA